MEAQEATSRSSVFGVPPASLSEDTPKEGGSLFSNTLVLQFPEPAATTVTQAIAMYKPPPPVKTSQVEGVWEEGFVEGAPHPADWKPTKLSQEDLDQALGEPLDPSTKVEESYVEKPKGTSLVLGIPAGCESDIESRSNLDEF